MMAALRGFKLTEALADVRMVLEAWRRRLALLREIVRAFLGDRDACHDLGALYATADHGAWPEIRDSSKAARWYERGASRGSAECLYDLGFMVVLGEVPGRDPESGIGLLEESAHRGYCEAIRVLSDLYSHGIHGFIANEEAAEFWRRKLAEHLARHPEDRREHER